MSDVQGKIQELWKRILFTLFMLAVYRLATQVPTPGVDTEALKSLFDSNSQSFFGILDKFNGGALQRFSVLALGIMPYITSSIIFSLLAISFPTIGEMQKESEGHKKIQQWSRYLTILLCAIQGFMLSVGLENSVSPNSGVSVVLEAGWSFRLMTMITLTAGTMFIMWMGEQITERGIGNGISLIIFAGIAAGIPKGISSTYELYKSGELQLWHILLIGVVMLAAFWIIIFVERAYRKVPVQYAKRVVNNRVYGGQSSHIPIKVNISGVMPPIFASALMSFPYTLKQFPFFKNNEILNTIISAMAPGQMLYNILFVGLIIFFAYFYATIQFKTGDISENMKKNGGFIPGIRPGDKTAEFLNFIVSRLTLVGAVYLALLCVLPTILIQKFGTPFYFGGTSLLILVGVAIDTMAQVEGFMISQNFDKAYKSRGKYKGARKF
jgi:preprotein translocase subunit SecY